MMSELHGARAIESDKAERFLDWFIMETHRAVCCAGVIDNKSDFDVGGRVGESIAHVVVGEIKGYWTRLDLELRLQ